MNTICEPTVTTYSADELTLTCVVTGQVSGIRAISNVD